MPTFKVFFRGNCRRVTSDEVPSLATINTLSDELVGPNLPSERRSFVYVDSEGDSVVLTTNRDITEAVYDANLTGAKTVKIHVVPRDANRFHHRKSDASPTNSTTNSETGPSDSFRGRHRCHVGSWPGMGSAWRFPHAFQPHLLHVEIDDPRDVIGDVIGELSEFFPGFCSLFHPKQHSPRKAAATPETETETKTGDVQDAASSCVAGATPKSDAAAPDSPRNVDANAAVGGDVAESAPVAVAEREAGDDHGDDGSAEDDASSSDFVKVEAPVPTTKAPIKLNSDPELESSTTKATAPAHLRTAVNSGPTEHAATGIHHHGIATETLNAKVKLLREMGFALPDSVARNMINEMGGRMDLIVRALVANERGKYEA